MTHARRAVLILALVVGAACASPLAEPTPAPTPTALSGELTHFSNGFGLDFDYPSEWPIISDGGDVTGADQAVAVLGTGSWDTGCVHQGNSVTCKGQQFIASPGDFVGSIVTRTMGPADVAPPGPPLQGSRLTSSGLAITPVEGIDRAIDATVYVPGHLQFDVKFRFGADPTNSERAAVEALLDSMVFTGERGEVRLDYWNSAGARECVRRTLVGQLTSAGGLNLASPVRAYLSWPLDWSTRTTDFGRVELFGDDGRFVAREWDRVSVGVRGDNGEFRVCPGAVRVVEEFPGN